MSEESSLSLVSVDGSSKRLVYADLVRLPSEHQVPDISLMIPHRKGAAVTLEGLVALMNRSEVATHIGLHSDSDDFHASLPLDAIGGRGLLIYRRDGRPLRPEEGGPFRFMIQEHAACHTAEIDACANLKYVERIELTIGRGQDNRPTTDQAHSALHASEEGS